MGKTDLDSSQDVVALAPNWRMPAEWHPQTAIWVAWPHNRATWPRNLAKAQAEFSQFVESIAETQRVNLVAEGLALRLAQETLSTNPNIRFVNLPTDDAWVRDYGPTFLIDEAHSRLAAVKWQYNAWGGKYPPYDNDQLAAQRIAASEKIPLHTSKLFLEGGAIEINDHGVLLTTKSCLLNVNRNPAWSQSQVEAELMSKLGARTIVWLCGNAIAGDDTDGHIDQFVRFVANDEIVYSWTSRPDDPRRTALRENLESLQRSLATHDLNLKLTPLNLPEANRQHGNLLPASYSNFLITNELVVVPQFDDAQDPLAVELLNDRFSTRKVIGLPSSNLSVGLGSFHCLSQQQPQQQSPSIQATP